MQLSLDSYILDVLMRDLAEHEKRPSAFLVYLYLWRHTFCTDQKVVSLSHQQLAEGTGLSKSAVQGAVRLLKSRKLLSVTLKNPTAIPVYRVERPWARRKQAKGRSQPHGSQNSY
jgi:hypothetical protein